MDVAGSLKDVVERINSGCGCSNYLLIIGGDKG
jgi:hypothetical protein